MKNLEVFFPVENIWSVKHKRGFTMGFQIRRLGLILSMHHGQGEKKSDGPPEDLAPLEDKHDVVIPKG